MAEPTHNHTRWRNDDDPWSPCPPSCPAGPGEDARAEARDVAIRPLTCDNETSRRGAGNTPTALTHLLDLGERGLAVKATQTCSIQECPGGVIARGWCGKHYERWRQHGDPTVIKRTYAGPDCEAPDCDAAATQGRYCATHRARLTRLGTFDLPDRDRYQQRTGYWVVKRPGHPVASDRGWVREHRVVLYDAIGPGEHACHWCRATVSWDKTYPRDRDGLVVDHIDEDASNNDPANLVPSCAVCNIARSNRWVKQRRKKGSA